MIRAILAACMLTAAAVPVAAQESVPEVIRGRVTDDSAHALVATVIVTRGPDRLVLKT